MFQMPMSSPMMTRMFGFGCCAEAGTLAIVTEASSANRPTQTFLVTLMTSPQSWLPEMGRQPAAGDDRDQDSAQWMSEARIRRSTIGHLTLVRPLSPALWSGDIALRCSRRRDPHLGRKQAGNGCGRPIVRAALIFDLAGMPPANSRVLPT